MGYMDFSEYLVVENIVPLFTVLLERLSLDICGEDQIFFSTLKMSVSFGYYMQSRKCSSF